MGFDSSSIVHVPRAEEHGDWYAGRDVLFTPQGRYVADARVVPFQDSPQLEVNFHVAVTDDWEELLEDQEIINSGATQEAHPSEMVLGKVDEDDIDYFRMNRWVQLEAGKYRVHMTNVDSEFPSTLEVYGGSSIRDFSPMAAEYAEDLAYIDLEEKPVSHQDIRDPSYSSQDMWEDLFIKSLSNANTRLEEVEQKK